jgi:carboxyl-terminal processing protease
MSAFEGRRRLLGEPGSKVTLTVIRNSQVDPHVVELTREILDGPGVSSRMEATGIGYVRVAGFARQSAAQIGTQAAALTRSGAGSLIIDLRGTATGEYEEAISAARLFVGAGTLAVRQARGQENQTTEARPGAAVTVPVALLTDIGTSGPAEVFAAALQSNDRADLVGSQTIGRVTMQKLVKLSDGSGLWLTGSRYLLPSGEPLLGLSPDVAIAQPEIEFGEPLPDEDETINRATEHLRVRPAA